MSLHKWKEMAEKRSKVGQDINTVRETIKQKKITDTMSDISTGSCKTTTHKNKVFN